MGAGTWSNRRGHEYRVFVLAAVLAAMLPMVIGAQGTEPPLYAAIRAKDLAAAQAAIAAGADVNAVYDQDTMLCWALRLEQAEIARMIVKSPKVNVNKYGTWYDDMYDWTRPPLILAAHMGQTPMVQLLLGAGADINARGSENGGPRATGNTALMKAAARNHAEVIRVLLTSRKIDMNLRDNAGKTALWSAVERENLETAKLLLDAGVKVNLPDNLGQSVLFLTIQNERTEMLDYLVSRGANINLVDKTGATPLIVTMASRKAGALRLEFLKAFLVHKPQLDFVAAKGSQTGYSALHAATLYGYTDYMGMLLDNGAAINIRSSNTGGTPLHTAASWKFPEALKLLIERGADLGALDDKGFTPLLTACAVQRIQNVKLLVDAGAVVNFAAKTQNQTPLIAAAMNIDPFKHADSAAAMKYLLEHSASPDFAGTDGRTALMIAVSLSDAGQGLEKTRLLLDWKANPDAQDVHKRTALMFAAGAGNEAAMKLLLDKGASVDLKSDAGETAMNYAVRSGKAGPGKLLAARGAEAAAPVAPVAPVALPAELVGSWRGSQDNLKEAVFYLTLSKNGSFTFESRYTDEVFKRFPKGSMNPVIATQKGTWTVNGNVLILNIPGEAPVSRLWKFEKKRLILDDMIRLDRSR